MHLQAARRRPLFRLPAFFGKRAQAARGDADLPAGQEEREILFNRVAKLAYRHGLHVAPAVSLAAVFSVRDGRRAHSANRAQSALASERVDVLILDRAGRPMLAVDYPNNAHSGRAETRRLRIKARVFDRGGLPLISLRGLQDWEQDGTRIDALLTEEASPETGIRLQG